MDSGVEVYIVDQHHEVQRQHLPENAVPGFLVEVWRGKTRLETFWASRKELAEEMAQEYHRQYAINRIWEELGR